MHHPNLTPPEKIRPDYEDPKYFCCICEKKFYEDDGGMKYELSEFCPDCVEGNQHYLFILECCSGNAKEANQLIESELKEI